MKLQLMKNIFIYLLLFGLVLTACNPNKEIYDELDAMKVPYRTDLEYTLTDDDYSAIADLAEDAATTEEEMEMAAAIADMMAFSKNIPVSSYVGPYLDGIFIAPDSGSSCMVRYRYLVNEYDSIAEYELSASDYDAIGGQVATDGAFSSAALPGNYLPDFLFDMDTTENYILYVTSEYIRDDMSQTDTVICFEYIDGSWDEADVYMLTDEDYDSMGAPGQYNNFSSSAEPDAYLPIFLEQKFPYAAEETKMTLVYKYYSGGVHARMDVYQYNGAEWGKYETQSDQFVHNGTQWLFDPTIKYTMLGDDYQIIVDYISAHPELNVYMDPSYDNTEYYYGASAYYGNFDMRITKRRDNDPLGYLTDLSDDEVSAELDSRLPEGLMVFIETKFSNAVPVSNGVQVYYEINYATYNYVDYFYTARFKCTGVGEFEYIETWENE